MEIKQEGTKVGAGSNSDLRVVLFLNGFDYLINKETEKRCVN